MHQVGGAKPPALTIFSPCGVVQTKCLPLMQEITGLPRRSFPAKAGAKPVRDAIFSARGSRGRADPPAISAECGIRSAELSSLRPRPVHSALCILHFALERASAQAGFISQPCPGQHWGLRPTFAPSATARQAISSPCGSLQARFVNKPGRGSTGRRPLQVVSVECGMRSVQSPVHILIPHSAFRIPH